MSNNNNNFDVTKLGFILKASSEEERNLLLAIQNLGHIYGFISIDEFLSIKEPPKCKADQINSAKFQHLRNKCLAFKEKCNNNSK